VNWDVLRREWGAVTFVLTVVAGMVVVPIALYLANAGPHPVAANPVVTPSAAASSANIASPSR
jgi:hypothetical protein